MPYAVRYKGTLALIAVATISSSAIGVLQPWPIKILVDHALGQVALPDWLTSFFQATHLEPARGWLVIGAGAATLAIFSANSALDVALNWGWMAAGQGMVYDLACDVFARLQRLSLRFHSGGSVGEWLDRLMTDTWVIYSITSDLLVSPFQQLLTLVGIGIVAWWLDPWLTVVSLSVAPLLAVSVRYFGPRLKQRAKSGREAQANLTRFVHQTITSIPLVQAFGAEQRNQQQFSRLADTAVAVSQRGVLVNKSFTLVNGLSNSLGYGLVVFLGGTRVIDGALSIGSLLVFLSYVRTLQKSWSGLLQIYAKMKTSEASLERLFEILDTEDLVEEAPEARPVPRSSGSRGARITFEQVTCGYVPGCPVLHDISLEVSPGEMIAVVGPTGAGKTSLVSLVPRFFDPWSGRVLFNGFDVRDAQLDSLRGQIAIVLQDPYLLPLSVAENIAYGRPGARPDEIEAAARAAHAHEFIQQLPHGYATLVGERGSTLSGGQKQRLSIARALLLDTDVVIFDEPTSALDATTESQLLFALESLRKGRTTFIIAHRLSTIRNADRIVVLDQGRIVETGTHEELLSTGRLYAELHAAQFGNVVEGAQA